MPSKYAGSPLPSNCVPFHATNASDVTSATPVAVKAAPSTTGQAHYITEITVTNKTAAESPVIVVQDGADTPVVIDTFAPGGLASVTRRYDPPRKVTTNKAINAKATSSVGDCLVTVNGFTGTPDADSGY